MKAGARKQSKEQSTRTPFRSRRYRNTVFVFLLFLCIAGSIQGYLSYRAIYTSGFEIEQRLNWSVAAALAEDLQPLLEDAFDESIIQRHFTDFLRYHPSVDLYLVAEDGTILLHAPFVRKNGGKPTVATQISTQPIKRFLATDSRSLLPIWGDLPTAMPRQAVFSAAPLEIAGRPGYLYAVLYGFNFSQIIRKRTDHWNFFKVLLVISIAALAVIGVSGGLAIAHVMRRFFTVFDSVQKISSGDYQHRITISQRGDEISELAEATNTMADRLVDSIDSAKRNEQITKDLVTNIVHDLNTPLAAVYGYLLQLQNTGDEMDAATRKEYTSIALENTARLTRLVSTILDLSKLQSGITVPQPGVFSLTELITEELLPTFQPLAAQQDISLELVAGPDIPYVHSDDSLIERVLSNLLENAIRYHDKPGGYVRLVLQQEGASVQVAVEDNGPGIADSEMPYIFERFYRGDKARQKRTGGSGLGLAIAKVSLEALGEVLYVTSRSGEGSSFYFKLPATPPSAL